MIPPVDQLLQQEEVRHLLAVHGRAAVLRLLRRILDGARARARAGDRQGLESDLAGLAERLSAGLSRASAPSIVPVINATGVVIHTNLGRAPLSPRASRLVAEVAASYTNLELDLERGEREIHVEPRLRELLSCEAALAVNNNAAAVLLAVNTLAEGREVLVSRGELVEIGGAFRIPDVLRKGGARLREVGTTNRTRLADYRGAIGPDTALVLKVHPSNFRIVGFTESVALEDLAGLAHEAGVPLVEDLGSGLLSPARFLPDEPSVTASLRSGADLVTFSADKILGGPQAGLAVGRRKLVDAMRRNALYRALRVDKMTLAGLQAVLTDHEADRARVEVPVVRMLALGADEVLDRARTLARRLQHDAPLLRVEVTAGLSAVGGGAAPGFEVPTALVALTHPTAGADRLGSLLRSGSPPVVARVADGRLVLDLRTVLPGQEDELRDAIVRAATMDSR